MMPTIEFFGYSHEHTLSLIEIIKSRLADQPFCHDIVFVLHPDNRSHVMGWDGLEHPFMRIASRSSERIEILRSRLNDQTDIETVLIGFYARATVPDNSL